MLKKIYFEEETIDTVLNQCLVYGATEEIVALYKSLSRHYDKITWHWAYCGHPAYSKYKRYYGVLFTLDEAYTGEYIYEMTIVNESFIISVLSEEEGIELIKNGYSWPL